MNWPDIADAATRPSTMRAVDKSVEAIAGGGIALVLGVGGRENAGCLVMAADAADSASLGFFVRHTSGVICASMEQGRLEELGLPPMVEPNSDSGRTAFTVSVDLRDKDGSGVSAAERAATLRALADRSFTRNDFSRPGHVFPLQYRPGGVLARPGRAEAALDLIRLAGRGRVAVLSEVVRGDGSLMESEALRDFAAESRIPMVRIDAIAAYRWRTERLARQVASVRLPTPIGDGNCYLYESVIDASQHVVFTLGQVASDIEPVLCRIHHECWAGDVAGSLSCDCGVLLARSMQQIGDAGRGVIVYLRTHGSSRIRHEHEVRTDPIAAHLLRDVGVSRARLLWSSAAERDWLQALEIEVAGSTCSPTFPQEEQTTNGRDGSESLIAADRASV